MKTRWLTALPVSVLALVQPLLARAQQAEPPYPPWGWHGPGHMWSGGWGGWWGGPLMMLGFVIACIVIILLLRRSGERGHHSHRGDPTHTALQILNERFARGEIQKPEYEEKKAALLSMPPR